MPDETTSVTEPATEPTPVIEERIRIVLGLLDVGTTGKLTTMMAQWSGGETAAVLEALPQPARQIYWSLVPDDLRGDVLAWLGDQVRADLLKKLDVEEVNRPVFTGDGYWPLTASRTLRDLWRIGQTASLDQGRNHWRCATRVHSKAKVRKAHERGLFRKHSKFTLSPQLRHLWLAQRMSGSDIFTAQAQCLGNA